MSQRSVKETSGVYNDPVIFPGKAREGVELFNQREYWESHEVWEDIWRTGNPTERLFYQGLIQVAAGFVKIQKVWHAPAVRNLQKGLSKLKLLTHLNVPIDLGSFVTEAQAVLDELVELGRVCFEQKSWNWWPTISYRSLRREKI